jgi:hypothetical protein
MNNEQALEELINRYMDGQATAEEVEQLNVRLGAHEEARALFVELLNLDAAIGASAAGWERVENPVAKVQSPIFHRCVAFFRLRPVRWAAAAALMAVLFAGAFWRWSSEPLSVALARLSDVSEPVWVDNATAPMVGSALGRQSLNLVSGAAQITFDSGVVLTLTGPADLELQSRDQVMLRCGGVSLYVPVAGHGFTVLSPRGRIIDLGTEFALDVDEKGGSRVHVINGSVRVEQEKSNSRASTQLTAGYSAQLNSSAPPLITQMPLLIDRFEGPDGAALNADLPRRQKGGRLVAEYRDMGPLTPARIQDGMLGLPVEGHPQHDLGIGRVMLARDFRELIGRRYTIAFKARLPEMGVGKNDTWVAFLLWDGEGGETLPLAFNPSASLALMFSTRWQAACNVGGVTYPREGMSYRVFERDESAGGPYQVVLAVDETRQGGAVADVTVNGLRIVTDMPVRFGKSRHVGFHTYMYLSDRSRGIAQIDDLTVSLESAGTPVVQSQASR